MAGDPHLRESGLTDLMRNVLSDMPKELSGPAEDRLKESFQELRQAGVKANQLQALNSEELRGTTGLPIGLNRRVKDALAPTSPASANNTALVGERKLRGNQQEANSQASVFTANTTTLLPGVRATTVFGLFRLRSLRKESVKLRFFAYETTNRVLIWCSQEMDPDTWTLAGVRGICTLPAPRIAAAAIAEGVLTITDVPYAPPDNANIVIHPVTPAYDGHIAADIPGGQIVSTTQSLLAVMRGDVAREIVLPPAFDVAALRAQDKADLLALTQADVDVGALRGMFAARCAGVHGVVLPEGTVFTDAAAERPFFCERGGDHRLRAGDAFIAHDASIGGGAEALIYSRDAAYGYRVNRNPLKMTAGNPGRNALKTFVGVLEEITNMAAMRDCPYLLPATDAKVILYNKNGTWAIDYYIVVPKLQGMNLAELIEEHRALPRRVMLKYLLGAARGLQHLHGANKSHGDLRLQNMLLQTKSPTAVCRLIDYGQMKPGNADLLRDDCNVFKNVCIQALCESWPGAAAIGPDQYERESRGKAYMNIMAWRNVIGDIVDGLQTYIARSPKTGQQL
eukprot:CAMPEP_0177637414 /NCGR_PEP_ID=MMETSP0447-20121125/4959_1 /TAXON_ID=0 /ORGANISM="Stygamoeba regulata, Strain BSH-02190019" /LENGTH=567 /DNA_ID=CAMNT_0019139341 /DNA_START=60 /DNA_END=1763 /DNA_ORIENTATION=-